MKQSIWTKDKHYADVTTLEQALWHLKTMRGSIRGCLNNPSLAQHMTEEDKEVNRVQMQALDIAIKYLSFECKGKFEKYIKGCQDMRKVMLDDENWENMKTFIEAVTYGGMALQRIQSEDKAKRRNVNADN